MEENIKTADFCIEIDFGKETENPSRIFKTMTELIDSFQKIDKTLVNVIDNKIEPLIILEDIEISSLKSWFKNVLNVVDDDAIKNIDWKPMVGKYLLKGKYLLLNFLDKKTTITDSKEVSSLQDDILKMAEETEIRRIPAYTPITSKKIIESIGNITQAISYLSEKDKAKYLIESGEASFNLEFNFIPEEIEDLLTKEVLESTVEMILKVKKPDYLGESKWEFRHDSTAIYAKITDEKWLSKFQHREIDVRPGDSIRAMVEIKQKYGYDLSIIGTHYNIIKVMQILPSDKEMQLSILEEENNEEKS